MENRQLGGVGFLIGNAALFANGLIANCFANTPESRKAGAGRMASSLLWSGSGAFLAKYGDRSVASQQARLQEKLAAFLKQSNVPLDAQAIRKAEGDTQADWSKKIEDFFYAHPIEYANAYNAIAGTGFAMSGALRRKDGNTKAGNANLGLSALMLTGALASIILPEKTPEQIEEKGQTGTLWGNIQEHPLAYVRWLFLGADALAGMEAIGEYQAAAKLPKHDRFRGWQFGMAGLSLTAMATMMASDWITSGSKKAGGAPQERDHAQQQMIAEAAKHLAKLPSDERERLIENAAEYMSQQAELRFNDKKPEELALLLRRQIDMHVVSLNQPSIGKQTVGQHTKKILHNASIQTVKI